MSSVPPVRRFHNVAFELNGSRVGLTDSGLSRSFKVDLRTKAFFDTTHRKVGSFLFGNKCNVCRPLT